MFVLVVASFFALFKHMLDLNSIVSLHCVPLQFGFYLCKSLFQFTTTMWTIRVH